MSEIPRKIFEQLVTIINPLMGDQEDRKAIVRLGVYDRNFIHRINFAGSAFSFTTNLLYELIEYDTRLLLQLIETLIKYGHVGGKNKEQLQQLHNAIQHYLNPKNTPPDGGLKILLVDKDTLDHHSRDHINQLVKDRFPDHHELYILDFQDSDFIMVIGIPIPATYSSSRDHELIYNFRKDHLISIRENLLLEKQSSININSIELSDSNYRISKDTKLLDINNRFNYGNIDRVQSKNTRGNLTRRFSNHSDHTVIDPVLCQLGTNRVH